MLRYHRGWCLLLLISAIGLTASLRADDCDTKCENVGEWYSYNTTFVSHHTGLDCFSCVNDGRCLPSGTDRGTCTKSESMKPRVDVYDKGDPYCDEPSVEGAYWVEGYKDAKSKIVHSWNPTWHKCVKANPEDPPGGG